MTDDSQLPLWAHALAALPGLCIFTAAFIWLRREGNSTRAALSIIGAWWAGILAVLLVLLLAFGGLNDLIDSNPEAGEKLGSGVIVFLAAVGMFVYGMARDKEKAAMGKKPHEAYDSRSPINNLADWGSGLGVMGMCVGAILIISGITSL